MLRQRWIQFLVAGIVLCAVGFFLPATGQGLIVQVVGLTACIGAYRAGTRDDGRASRPWRTVACAGFLLLVAPLVRELQAGITGVEDPFPSLGDPFSFAGYLLLILGVNEIAASRRTESDRDNLIDSLILACGLGVLIWVLALGDYVADPTTSELARAANVGYFCLTLVLVVVTARLAVGPGSRTASYYFLASAIAAIVVADLLATFETTGDVDGEFLAVAAMVYVLMGTAALHPTRSRIADPVDEEIRLTASRIVMLATALFLVPMLVLVGGVTRDDPNLPLLITGSVVLPILVLSRLISLVWARERTAVRERQLRFAGLQLVTARSSDETNTVTLEAVAGLVGGLGRGRASIVRVEQGYGAVVASTGDRSELAVDTQFRLSELDEVRRSALSERGPSSLGRTSPIDLPDGADLAPASSVFVLPLVTQAEVRGAIVVSSEQTIAPRVVRALEALGTEVSFAIESAALNDQLHREKSERRFRALVEHSSDLILVVDHDHRCIFASPAVGRLLGRDETYLDGPIPSDLVHPLDEDRFAALVRIVGGLDDDPSELRFLHADGTYRWFEVRARDLTDEAEIGGVVLTARDITDRHAAEARLARSEARFRALVQNSSDVVAVIDEQAFFTYVSPAIGPMLGFPADELVGTNVMHLLPADEVTRAMKLLEGISPRPFEQLTLEMRLRDLHGIWRNVDITISDMRNEPAVQGIVLNIRDVTVRRALEQDLEHKTLHDELTGLGNRAMFNGRLSRALGRNEPRLDQVAVLFVDIDDFKEVNDSLGHEAGDQLLIAAAERLRGCLRVSDTAARLGGDDFAVLLEDTYGESEIFAVADRILEAIASPFAIDGRDLTVSASIGVAIDPTRTSTGEVLLRSADVAMYLAKERGKGRYEMFQAEVHSGAFERLELKAALSQAIQNDELVLHYQPIVDLRSHTIHGCEALVRWDHPERGVIPPSAFVTLAEESGLVVPLGMWVLAEACSQLRAWEAHDPRAESLRVSVNLSVRQIESSSIVEDVRSVLAEHGVDPHRITLEITESLVMDDSPEIRERLEDLRAIGLSLAVDDFGTGFSSLGYIQRFPVDIIKIDRGFVDRLDAPGGTSGVVRTIVELSRDLHTITIAEGIETAAQLEHLVSLRCQYGQGHYFSPAVPGAEFADLLANPERLETGLTS